MEQSKIDSPPRPRRTPRIKLPASVSRYQGAQFLVSLMLLIIAAPFVQEIHGGDLFVALLMTLMLCSAVAVMAGRARLVPAILLALPAIGGSWINHHWPSTPAMIVAGIGGIVFIVRVACQLIGRVIRSVEVNFDVLCSALCGYLLLAIVWAMAYTLVAKLVPNSFHFLTPPHLHRGLVGVDMVYFSFITLGTVGYGDIAPVSNAARVLAMLEAMTGMVYVTVLIARLVALYSATSKPPEARDELA